MPGLLVGGVLSLLFYQFVDSPKEAQLKRENQQLLVQYELLNKQMAEVEDVLGDVRRRDDNIYRVIFEADPLPESMRQAGFGGANRYRGLEGFANEDVVIGTRKRLDRIAKQLEGVNSNASTHAAGIVISREPLTELMPLQRATNSDALMTQYEMHGVEALGLLKMDFLGLRNLTILSKTVDLIEQTIGLFPGRIQACHDLFDPD